MEDDLNDQEDGEEG